MPMKLIAIDGHYVTGLVPRGGSGRIGGAVGIVDHKIKIDSLEGSVGQSRGSAGIALLPTTKSQAYTALESTSSSAPVSVR